MCRLTLVHVAIQIISLPLSGILAVGRLICWGNNDYGEMGNLAEPKHLKEGEPKCESEDKISSKCISHFEGKWALTEFGGVAAGKRQV